MAMLKRLLMVLVAVLLIAVPASLAQGAPGGGPGRPPDAGNGGGGGGNPNKGPGQKLGDLYADLWVIARDDTGLPMTIDLLGETCLRPITDTYLVDREVPGDPGMYFIPLVGEAYTPSAGDAVVALSEDDELAPCDVDPAYLLEVDEVDLGRLNLGRAPVRVLDKQLGDVVSTLFGTNVTNVIMDASGRYVAVEGEVQTTLDSPLANLAVYQEILKTLTIDGYPPPEFPSDQSALGRPLTPWEITAAALAAGAPKEGFEITDDTVQYLNRILAVPAGAEEHGGMPVLETTVLGESFLDFDSMPAYTRSAMFPGYINYYPPGQGATCVSILNHVFTDGADGYVEASEPNGGLAAYVQFAEDARKVLVAVHGIGEAYLIGVDCIGSNSGEICP